MDDVTPMRSYRHELMEKDPKTEPWFAGDTYEPIVADPDRNRPQTHRRFVLRRDVDITGVSGTGIVAEGVEFSEDGVVALRWLGGFPTSVVFHDKGMESVEKVHGHDGATQIVWLD